MKKTGLKLNFGKNKDGKNKISFTAGTKIKPHRNVYIKNKLKNREFEGLIEIFFDQSVPKYDNNSTMEQLIEEGELLTEYLELTQNDHRYNCKE